MIRVLPTEVISQIAAGEVIERPFSVVKELVENSLDAAATRVVVEIEQGGTTAVRVTDDGLGCGQEDLPLAFVAHATSKLQVLADLDRIASLGFRGEALASIGSVARARMCSRQRGQESGWAVECHGGVVSAPQPCAMPEGTSVEARDLFFNTPARRRFLKAPYAERARVHDLLARLALPRLDVAFTLISDGKTVLDLPAGETLAARIGRAFGQGLVPGLVPVRLVADRHQVEGAIVDPDQTRSDATLELLYVNGRLAKDRGAGMAVRQAFRAFLMHGRYPAYFLALSLPPELVDVNVHPTKTEVRFADPRKVAGLLHVAVQKALQARGGGLTAGAGAGSGMAVHEQLPRAHSGFPALPQDLFGREIAAEPPAAASPAAAPRVVVPNPFRMLRSTQVLQVLDLYLVLEGQHGLVVVDQHALHERILYERLRRRQRETPAQIQRLLVPEVVELPPLDKSYVLEAREALAAEGFLVDDFGGNAVAISGLPLVLAKANARVVLTAFLRAEGIDAPRPRAQAAIAERFHSMACRGAVMSGDRLQGAEIEALLLEARDLEHPHNCPHGRPTVLSFSRLELEKYFRRRV